MALKLNALQVNALTTAAGLIVFTSGLAVLSWPFALLFLGAALVATGLFLNVGQLLGGRA